ncbi:hypothetical protein PROPEN_04894 [Proteus penneri ATCC 35198]|nr:hypothetical protein PROPEN_04894 [Proteus penneri ATCC 35198]
MKAVTGKDPQEHYNELAQRFGSPSYNRIQASATHEQKSTVVTFIP